MCVVFGFNFCGFFGWWWWWFVLVLVTVWLRWSWFCNSFRYEPVHNRVNNSSGCFFGPEGPLSVSDSGPDGAVIYCCY